jgi:hypothetical protein
MLQLVVLMVGTILSAGYGLMHSRAETTRMVQLRGDVAAISFMSYQQALVQYRIANPSVTGTVAFSSLTAPAGYVQDSRWTNLITGGELYVYTTSTPPEGMAGAVFKKNGYYIMTGIKLSTGALLGPQGSVAASLPAAIPTGSLVYVGS